MKNEASEEGDGVEVFGSESILLTLVHLNLIRWFSSGGRGCMFIVPKSVCVLYATASYTRVYTVLIV